MTDTLRLLGFSLIVKDFQEDSQFIYLYTEELGWKKIFAKGIRKITSKMRGQVSPFGMVNVEVFLGRQGMLLMGALCEEDYGFLNNHFNSLSSAISLSQVLDHALVESETLNGLWKLLGQTMSMLNHPAFESKASLVEAYFYYQFLKLNGIVPNINLCVVCGEPVSNDVHFSVADGGIVHERCAKAGEDIHGLADRDYALMKIIKDRDIKGMLKFENNKKIKELYRKFTYYHIS